MTVTFADIEHYPTFRLAGSVWRLLYPPDYSSRGFVSFDAVNPYGKRCRFTMKTSSPLKCVADPVDFLSN